MIYILYVGWTGCSYLLASGSAIIKKQYLSWWRYSRLGRIFCIFICFPIIFQINFVAFLFVWMFVSSVKLHFLRAPFLSFAKKISQTGSFQFWTDAYTGHIESIVWYYNITLMTIENRALWLARSFASSRYNHRAVIITLKASSFQNGSQICWCFGVGNWSIILFSRIIINVIVPGFLKTG